MKRGASYDTRFLVELYYSSNKENLAVIKTVLLNSKPNYISTVALSEIYKLTLEREGRVVAEIRSSTLCNSFHLVNVDKEIAVGAALIKHKHTLPFADSIIASTAKILKVPCYTDDPHFKDIEGIAVKWFP